MPRPIEGKYLLTLYFYLISNKLIMNRKMHEII